MWSMLGCCSICSICSKILGLVLAQRARARTLEVFECAATLASAVMIRLRFGVGEVGDSVEGRPCPSGTVVAMEGYDSERL
jgi:hypothetical protein